VLQLLACDMDYGRELTAVLRPAVRCVRARTCCPFYIDLRLSLRPFCGERSLHRFTAETQKTQTFAECYNALEQPT